MHCRKYQLMCEARTSARTDFRRRHPHMNGRKGATYPAGMEELPMFSD